MGQLSEGVQGQHRHEQRIIQHRLLLQETGLASLPEATYVVSSEGRILSANPAMAQLTGYAVEDLLDRYSTEFYRAEDTPAFLKRRQQALQGKFVLPYLESELITKNRVRLPVELSVTTLRVEERLIGRLAMVRPHPRQQQVAAAAQCIQAKREWRVQRRPAALRQPHAQLRALTRRLQSLQEAERTHLARELHDTMAQPLVGLGLDAAWLARQLTTAPPAWQAHLQAMQDQLQHLLTLTRQIATLLRPAFLQTGEISVALDTYLRTLSQRAELRYALTTQPDEITLEPERATALFRIAQEALINVAQHAAAHRVSVSLIEQGEVLTLTVTDDGKGIAPDQLAAPTSLGLLSMRERAARWGGEITIASKPGRGTTVTVQMRLGH
jgi:PAS domain S-box-containing protein